MEKHGGHFVISLDFELYWGMFDKVTLAEYGDHILGERTAIPRMLMLFKEYGIHATWATVGMIMARNKQELLSLLPPEHLRPTYADMRISAYTHLATASVGDDETHDIYHFGNDLVRLIQRVPYQEIGNHTFSHFYCIDGNHNDASVFAADLAAFARIAQTYDIVAHSIVFPRNQMNEEALRVCAEKGMLAYRGNESHFLYKPRTDAAQTNLVRAFRLVDHYLNLSGHHTYPLPTRTPGIPLNIPASRFLRPFMPQLKLLEPLRLRRIKKSMTHAAKRGEVFHLWWHPHNFGIHQEENFRNLEDILLHFAALQKKYGMQSASMSDLSNLVT
jgi:peptidoglycan/xylan/chitin deacetylase (PgdA/CDA1 family)